MHYVLSDIHGDSDAFARILSMICLQPEDHLYVLGDVIDRGPDGIILLQEIRKMDNATLLLGNHELMMINALRHPEKTRFARIWQNNSCSETWRDYNRLSCDEQESLLCFLESLPLQTAIEVAQKTYVLVHAAPIETFERLNWQFKDPREFAVWFRLRHEQNIVEGKTVIHGHTPTKHVQAQPWPKMRIIYHDGAINIDSGSGHQGFGGQLACIRLDDMTEYYSDEGVVTAEEAGLWREEMRRRWEEGWLPGNDA